MRIYLGLLCGTLLQKYLIQNEYIYKSSFILSYFYVLLLSPLFSTILLFKGVAGWILDSTSPAVMKKLTITAVLYGSALICLVTASKPTGPRSKPAGPMGDGHDEHFLRDREVAEEGLPLDGSFLDKDPKAASAPKQSRRLRVFDNLFQRSFLLNLFRNAPMLAEPGDQTPTGTPASKPTGPWTDPPNVIKREYFPSPNASESPIE